METERIADPICEKAIKIEEAKGDTKADASRCAALSTVTVSEPVRITPEIAAAHGNPLLPTGERLADAAAARRVYYQTWAQDMRGIDYINWYEKHEGLYYFDGAYAWVAPRYGWDAHGYHQCDLGYGLGYDVQVTNCGTHGQRTSTVVVTDTFRVHVIYRGIPIFNTYTMSKNLGRNGI